MSSCIAACSTGILIVVAIGVALGVLIGGILLSFVAYYMRRYSCRAYFIHSVIVICTPVDRLPVTGAGRVHLRM